MKCRVTAGGASYEFTEKSLASARVKSCRRPLEIRLPRSSSGVEMAGRWGFLCKTSNYCAAFFVLHVQFAYCQPNVAASPAVQPHLSFTFPMQTSSVVLRLPIVRQFALAQMLMCLLYCCPSAALLSGTVFLCLQLQYISIPLYISLYLALSLAAGLMQCKFEFI